MVGGLNCRLCICALLGLWIAHLRPARIIRDGSASPAIAWSNLYFVTESDNNKLGVLVGVFHWNGVLGVLIAIFLYWDGGFVL